jgi:hypothetical protein
VRVVKNSSSSECKVWEVIIKEILRRPPHKDVIFPKELLPHPKLCGFLRRIGFPQGQIADWEVVLSDGRSVHVKEFRSKYKVHWDFVSPRVSIIDHLRKDSPKCWIVLSAGMAALIGSLLGGLHTALEGFLGGALLGILTSIR